MSSLGEGRAAPTVGTIPGEKTSVPHFTNYEKILVLIFFLTLPLVNPWVRGDGVGYYAFARAMLIEHRLDFTQDWLNANESFRMDRIEENNQIRPNQYTVTGHLDNHFAVGSAILWAPFLVAAHLAVLAYDHLGGHVAADGFSRPYRLAMGLGTAAYGFGAILISFRLAREFVAEKWAFLAALGIWFASSLPVYMYFNPSWSHASSAFIVALFIWFWIRTRESRSATQWIVLGLIGGLMLDVYYVNIVVLLLPAIESLARYGEALRKRGDQGIGGILLKNGVFAAALLLAFSPTLITKKIIYGGYTKVGYVEPWYWRSPAIFKVAFSSDHGLFSWTPILLLSACGLLLGWKYNAKLYGALAGIFAALLYVIGCYADWDGLSSYGNRFFVSLTAIFVVGLAAFFAWLEREWNAREAMAFGAGATAFLVLWNLALIFQWGTHLVPARGPVSWREVAYNQVVVVPANAGGLVRRYFTQRQALMNRIEQSDVERLKGSQESAPKP